MSTIGTCIPYCSLILPSCHHSLTCPFGDRLAPEYPSPAATDDVWEVLLWSVSDGVNQLHLNVRKLAIVGMSYGGFVAAVITQRAAATRHRSRKIRICLQILLVPVTNHADPWDPCEPEEVNETGPPPSKQRLQYFRRHCIPNEAEWGKPEASPLLASDEVFRNLPPALIVVADNDVLRPQGTKYQKKLTENGVSAQIIEPVGSWHAFIANDRIAPEGMDTIKHVCDVMSAAFRGPDCKFIQ